MTTNRQSVPQSRLSLRFFHPLVPNAGIQPPMHHFTGLTYNAISLRPFRLILLLISIRSYN